MKAPGKIYINPMSNPSSDGGYVGIAWIVAHRKMNEYIRKDFLLEWAEQEKRKTSIGLSEYDAGHENARMELLNDLIDKINTL